MMQQLAQIDQELEMYEAEAQKGLHVEYLVKWRGLPYCECTWEAAEALEDFKEEVEDFRRREVPYP